MRWPFVLRSTHDAALAAVQATLADVSAARWQAQDEVRREREISHKFELDYDAMETRAEGAEERERYARSEYANLLEKYHALKLQGASVPEPKPTLVPNKPQGPIAEAIDAVCERFGNSVKLRRRLMKYADDTKREAPDMDEADIAHSITHWKGPDDEEAA